MKYILNLNISCILMRRIYMLALIEIFNARWFKLLTEHYFALFNVQQLFLVSV